MITIYFFLPLFGRSKFCLRNFSLFLQKRLQLRPTRISINGEERLTMCYIPIKLLVGWRAYYVCVASSPFFRELLRTEARIWKNNFEKKKKHHILTQGRPAFWHRTRVREFRQPIHFDVWKLLTGLKSVQCFFFGHDINDEMWPPFP